MKAFIQLGRFGDIISILPAIAKYKRDGNRIGIMTMEKFAGAIPPGLAHEVAYSPTYDLRAARKAVEAIWPHAEIIVPQVDLNPEPRTKRNFILDQWARAGLPEEEFYNLPFPEYSPDIGNLNLNGHAKLLDKRPVGYCFNSHSSPFPADVAKQIAAALGAEAIDLGDVKAGGGKILDMLAVLRSLSMLVTVDTALLHLSAWSKTPTVALVNDNPAQASQPRPHWIDCLTYKEAAGPAGIRRIAAAIAAPSSRFRHVVTWHDSPDVDEARRNRRASESWEYLQRQSPWDTLRLPQPYARSSATLAGGEECKRTIPFVKDVMDYACAGAKADDIIVYTNCDTLLPLDLPYRLREHYSAGVDCGYCSRVERPGEPPIPFRLSDVTGRPCPGTDLFSFRPSWWAANRDEFPDVLTAYEGWDFVMRQMMKRTPGSGFAPSLLHEIHAVRWQRPEILLKHGPQMLNRRLCKQWAMEHGFAKRLTRWHERGYLFKADNEP